MNNITEMKVIFELKNGGIIASKLAFVKWTKEMFGIGLREAKDICDTLCVREYVEVSVDKNKDTKKIKESFDSYDFGDGGNLVIKLPIQEMRESKLYRVLGGNDRMLNAIIEAVNWREYVTEEDEENLTIADIKKKIIEQIYKKYKL